MTSLGDHLLNGIILNIFMNLIHKNNKIFKIDTYALSV